MDQLLLESLRVVALPMKTKFRGVTVREAALIQGEYGWGEFSPFLEYDDAESAPWLACAIEAATQPKPKLYRTEVAVNGTIPALNDAEELERVVNSFPGVTTFKVKVGTNANEDIARINIIRSLRPGAKIRLDVKVVGDEVLRKAKDPFAIDLSGAVDYVMLKVQPLGGIKRSHQLAVHHNLPIVVSSALESAVGINYGVILAASFEDMKFECGLGTGSLIGKNVAELPIVEGKIAISDVVPNLEGLDVGADRYEWWKNRIMRTAELLK
jgi:O-succinylbenzoate synthase